MMGLPVLNEQESWCYLLAVVRIIVAVVAKTLELGRGSADNSSVGS